MNTEHLHLGSIILYAVLEMMKEALDSVLPLVPGDLHVSSMSCKQNGILLLRA